MRYTEQHNSELDSAKPLQQLLGAAASVPLPYIAAQHLPLASFKSSVSVSYPETVVTKSVQRSKTAISLGKRQSRPETRAVVHFVNSRAKIPCVSLP